MRVISIVVAVFILSGCSMLHYKKTDKGRLQGKLVVQWIDYDKFMFLPDEDSPLAFTRSNGEIITPRKMYTDGGSIPRALWAFKNYSPWGYAPAFIIHDWLFEMKHCQYAGYENYDHKEAAKVMSEVLKTLMEHPEYGGRNEDVLYSMYQAVSSSIAKELWEEGECASPTTDYTFAIRPRPKFEYTINFSE
jgi:hypothetical protein